MSIPRTGSGGRKPIVILMADDDEEDREFAREAFETSRLANDFRTVEDGKELLDYLNREGDYAAAGSAPRPGIILLDLKMPRLGGLEALERIKADPELARIPVIVLTTSGSDEDITRSYDLRASSFIRKPVTFDGLVTAIRSIEKYWFEIVQLPSSGD